MLRRRVSQDGFQEHFKEARRAVGTLTPRELEEGISDVSVPVPMNGSWRATGVSVQA